MKGTSKESAFKRITRVRNAAIELASTYQVIDVACETYMPSARQAQGSISTLWLHGVVNHALCEAGYRPAIYVAPSTLKKWWGGHGRADKEEMAEGAMFHFDEEFDDDNQCDAFLLAQSVRILNDWMRGEYEADKYEAKVMQKWKRFL